MKAIACSISNRALSRAARQERELARREEMKRELLEEMNLRELVRYGGSFRSSEVEADRKRWVRANVNI